MITVRNETTEDLDGIRAVDKAVIATSRQTYHPNKKAIYNKTFVSKHSKKIVAVSGYTIVGTASYFIEERPLKVMGLVVYPNFRRRGIAR